MSYPSRLDHSRSSSSFDNPPPCNNNKEWGVVVDRKREGKLCSTCLPSFCQLDRWILNQSWSFHINRGGGPNRKTWPHTTYKFTTKIGWVSKKTWLWVQTAKIGLSQFPKCKARIEAKPAWTCLVCTNCHGLVFQNRYGPIFPGCCKLRRIQSKFDPFRSFLVHVFSVHLQLLDHVLVVNI